MAKTTNSKTLAISKWNTTIPEQFGGINASYALFQKFFKDSKTPLKFRYTINQIFGYGSEADCVELGKKLEASKEINQYQEIDYVIV